jgi:hypothetical protein
MYSINMNKNILHITSDMSQMAALKEISRDYRANPDFLTIDLSLATFVLSRDFFLVLSHRLPSDVYKVILPNTPPALIATSLGIQTEIAGVQAEFDRQYGAKDIATHNMSMLEYLWYEIRR